MQHSVEITSEDYWAFTNFVGSRSGTPKYLSLMAGGFLFVALTYTAFHLIESGKSLDYEFSDWIAGPGLILLLFAITQFVNRKYWHNAYGPMPDRYVLGVKRYDISDEGLIVSQEWSITTFQWPAIVNIDETDDHLFLLLDSNAALIIPRRSFAATSEYDEFRSRVEDLCAEAK